MTETETTIKYKNPNITQVGIPTREPPKIEWNDKSIKAYTDLDLIPPDNLCYFEKKFLGLVDVSKGPVERSVVAIVRLIAPDYLSVKKDNEKPERKEFIYYQERWEGKDFLNRPLNPVAEHFEGKYVKQFTKPHINQQTGEVDYMELDPTKAQTIYYLPYSKKTVDDIISKSVNTDKDSIVFTIRFGSDDSPTGQRQMPSRNQFTYEQFVWPWDQVYKHNFKPTVQAYMEWVNKEKSKDGLSFEPT